MLLYASVIIYKCNKYILHIKLSLLFQLHNILYEAIYYIMRC